MFSSERTILEITICWRNIVMLNLLFMTSAIIFNFFAHIYLFNPQNEDMFQYNFVRISQAITNEIYIIYYK